MVTVHAQYVVDENSHRKAVLIPVAEWEQILEELEELDDIRAYDAAKAGPQAAVAFDEVVTRSTDLCSPRSGITNADGCSPISRRALR